MKAVIANRSPSIESLEVIEKDIPTLLDNRDLLIKINAVGINPIDWKQIERKIGNQPEHFVPCSDFSGIVAKVPESLHSINVGDKVFGMAGINRNGSGALAEFATTSFSNVSVMPVNISFHEAAAIPMTLLRAWHSLINCLKITSGEKILIHGGSGGIGTFAIQIAQNIGAEVTTTARTSNLSKIKELFHCSVIDYQKESLSDYKDQFDIVFDTVGGKTYFESLLTLKKNGRITSVFRDRAPEIELARKIEFCQQSDSATAKNFLEIKRLVEKNDIKIFLDKVFRFEDYKDALKYQRNGNAFGKVVISLEDITN